jgi:hypothetical protein
MKGEPVDYSIEVCANFNGKDFMAGRGTYLWTSFGHLLYHGYFSSCFGGPKKGPSWLVKTILQDTVAGPQRGQAPLRGAGD